MASFLHLNGDYSNVICDHSLVCLSIICIISNNIHKIFHNTFFKVIVSSKVILVRNTNVSFSKTVLLESQISEKNF